MKLRGSAHGVRSSLVGQRLLGVDDDVVREVHPPLLDLLDRVLVAGARLDHLGLQGHAGDAAPGAEAQVLDHLVLLPGLQAVDPLGAAGAGEAPAVPELADARVDLSGGSRCPAAARGRSHAVAVLSEAAGAGTAAVPAMRTSVVVGGHLLLSSPWCGTSAMSSDQYYPNCIGDGGVHRTFKKGSGIQSVDLRIICIKQKMSSNKKLVLSTHAIVQLFETFDRYLKPG